eukprot:4918592-Prymnesium_polylepis.1
MDNLTSAHVDQDQIFCIVAEIAGGELDVDTSFVDAGLDSLSAVELRDRLQRLVPQTLPSTLVFDHPTVRRLSLFSTNDAVPFPVQNVDAPITGRSYIIDGASVHVPTNAHSIVSVWNLTSDGHNAVSQVPLNRWDVSERSGQESVASRIRHAGFLVGAHLFDCNAFAISEAECRSLDPQQRYLLELGYLALHDASLQRASLMDSTTGIFVAAMESGFTALLDAAAAASLYAGTGNAVAVASGRLSYVLGMQGPCMSLDTACSASLVTCYFALSTLASSESVKAVTA